MHSSRAADIDCGEVCPAQVHNGSPEALASIVLPEEQAGESSQNATKSQRDVEQQSKEGHEEQKKPKQVCALTPAH